MVCKGVWKCIGDEGRLLEELVRLDGKEGVSGITLEEKREKDRVISNVKQLALMEETLLR